MDALISALHRYGGVIAAPRATVAGLTADEGQRDGLVLGGLYVLTVGTYALMEGIAGIVATRDLNALIMLASTLGRVLVAPILVLVAAETLLGAGRSHRRGLSMVPMLVAAIVVHELSAWGVAVPPYCGELVGGGLGLGLAWWIRDAVVALPTVARGKKARASTEESA